MYILGISCFYHDSAAVILKNGELIAAAEEERFSRKKHDNGFPKLAVDFCLKSAGLTKSDQLDYIVFYEKPLVKFERILRTCVDTFPRSLTFFRKSMQEWLSHKLWLKTIIASDLKINNSEKILFSDHHLSHAASCFYPSPFTRSAVLTIDGVGEWTTASIGIGNGNTLKLHKTLKFPESVGLLYSAFTAFLGFEVNEGEYKMMGMAAFGKPQYYEKVRKIVKIFADGSIKLNLDYFTHQYGADIPYTSKIYKLFGQPRSPKSLFFTRTSGYPRYFGDKPVDFLRQAKNNEYYADIAASIQKVTEEIIIKMAHYALQQTQSDNLCLAGGVALNSVANGLIEKNVTENLFVQPAAGDSGGALGAALYVYHHILGNKKRQQQIHAFLGKSYNNNQVQEILNQKKIDSVYIASPDKLCRMITKFLMEGKVIGWFQDRFEWGPRALGHRSILGDPRNPLMKDIINSKIKFREPYRPFAPSVLEEEAHKIFEMYGKPDGPSRFMITVYPIKKHWQKKIPAVTHADGSGRLQTVNKSSNPLYYQLINTFYKKTGVPLILNTSFNLKGEPIVESPQDALQAFSKCDMDILVLENNIISKL
ncbi:MAG: carbamoyltransferase [Patescibacteria group bacterium]